jgi:hypothetical protein
MSKLEVGDRFKNKQGYWYTIMDVHSPLTVIIKFDHKDFIKKTTASYARNGLIKLPSMFVGDIVHDKLGNLVTISNIDTTERITFKWEDGYERVCQSSVLKLNTLMREEHSQLLNPSVKVGDSFKNNKGDVFIVKEYIKASKIVVEFQEPVKHCVISSMGNIKRGNVGNKHTPTVCNIGIVGDCILPVKSKAYTSWVGMLKRVYNVNPNIIAPTYEDCIVSEDWFHLENYNNWFTKQYVQDNWELDKDLLVKNNKVYSSETCIFLPREINAFMTDRVNHRGEWPVGVTYHARLNKWQATCNFDSKSNYLGVFTDPTQAFLVYKEYKEGCAKVLAKRWEGLIDKRGVEALLNFTVSIDD